MKSAYWIAVIWLVVYEVIALSNAVPGDTISEIQWRLIDDYPVVSFFWGVLMGHFVWPRKVYARQVD